MRIFPGIVGVMLPLTQIYKPFLYETPVNLGPFDGTYFRTSTFSRVLSAVLGLGLR